MSMVTHKVTNKNKTYINRKQKNEWDNESKKHPKMNAYDGWIIEKGRMYIEWFTNLYNWLKCHGLNSIPNNFSLQESISV